ncbi:hypothetical protein EES42_40370 [Streptomyces sp. ADI95-17]|nr:hypothetical protein EES42_40370 [Streptomyces sp. ADI95-17]
MGQSDPGAESSAYPWSVVGAVGAIGAVAPGAAGELFTELSSFTKFRDRIDGLLRDLKASPAGPGKVGEDTVGRSQFGGGEHGGWYEADDLHGVYGDVITNLEQLSKLLSDSIEGLGIAVLASQKGYENLDLDIRDRMLAIKNDVVEYHGRHDEVTHAPEKQPVGDGGSQQPHGGAHKKIRDL